MKRKELKSLFSKLVLGDAILNILFLIFGIIIYMNPAITLKTVGIVIGVYFIIFGLFAIVEFFMRSASPLFRYKIFSGILSVLLGVFVIVDPFRIIKILTFTLGLYLIVVSIVKGLEAFKLKKYGYDGWLITFVTAVVLLIFGIFIAINPMASLDLIKATGIFIILSSILEICNLIMIYSNSKDLVKLFKD